MKLTSPHILLSTKRRERHVSFLHVHRWDQVLLGRISTNMNSNFGHELFIFWFTGAKYRQECFPDFTTVKESVLSILNTKKGAAKQMELLHKSGQLSNVVIFKAPHQIGGDNSHATDPGRPGGRHFIETNNRDFMPSADSGKEGGKASHATDPGKPAGSHFIKTKNRDSMPSADRAKASHATDPGKPAGSHFIETNNCDSVPTVDRGKEGAKTSHATDPGKPAGAISSRRRIVIPHHLRIEPKRAIHATDPEKPAGSHLIKTKNCDSMPTADRARKAGKASFCKPKSGSTECYVLEEVNPVDKTPLSEKGSRFANTKKKAAAQLVFEGVVPSFKSCAVLT